MNRDLITQLMSSYQRMLKRFVRNRMLVVAEAQEHYEYEERNGQRYVVTEEVLLVDENGNETIEERPKLMVPDLHLKPMSLKDESKAHEEMEALRAAGVPISLRRRMTNIEVDLDEEIEASREERIMLAVEEQKTRKATYLALAKEGLPIPEDLQTDFAAMAEEESDAVATPAAEPSPIIPALGETEQPIPNLAPVAGDPGSGLATDPAQGAPGAGPMEGQHRPPESDEMRADMPKAATRRRRIVRADADHNRLSKGPSHLNRVGIRVLSPDHVRRPSEDDDEPVSPSEAAAE